MRKATLVVLAAILCAAAGYGGTASIVASFRSPCARVCGIDYHGGYLYHGDGQNYIYRTTTTGSLLNSLNVGNASWGIDRTDDEFWTCNIAGFIFRLSKTGSVIRSFEGPSYPGYGITNGEGFLWYSTATYTYKMNITASLISSFRLPASRHRGLCWDEPYLWTADNGTRRIFQITQTGSVVDSFSINENPYGVTKDGSYLWYSASNNWVYKTKLCYTAVEPASLGRVKAVYR